MLLQSFHVDPYLGVLMYIVGVRYCALLLEENLFFLLSSLQSFIVHACSELVSSIGLDLRILRCVEASPLSHELSDFRKLTLFVDVELHNLGTMYVPLCGQQRSQSPKW
jgi:hypothetical protein